MFTAQGGEPMEVDMQLLLPEIPSVFTAPSDCIRLNTANRPAQVEVLL